MGEGGYVVVESGRSLCRVGDAGAGICLTSQTPPLKYQSSSAGCRSPFPAHSVAFVQCDSDCVCACVCVCVCLSMSEASVCVCVCVCPRGLCVRVCLRVCLGGNELYC